MLLWCCFVVLQQLKRNVLFTRHANKMEFGCMVLTKKPACFPSLTYRNYHCESAIYFVLFIYPLSPGIILLAAMRRVFNMIWFISTLFAWLPSWNCATYLIIYYFVGYSSIRVRHISSAQRITGFSFHFAYIINKQTLIENLICFKTSLWKHYHRPTG